MKILEKDNLPEEIIENDLYFKETVYLLELDQDFNYERISKFYESYNRVFDAQEYFEDFKKLQEYYTGFNQRLERIYSDSRIRRLIKTISKDLKIETLSKNKMKKLISSFISRMMYEVSSIYKINLYRTDYIDIFMSSISDDDLYDEFKRFSKRMLTIKSVENDRNWYILEEYVLLHAKYISEKINDECRIEKLQEIKKNINYLLSLSNKEIDKLSEQKKKDREKIQVQSCEDFVKEVEKDPKIKKFKDEEDEFLEGFENIKLKIAKEAAEGDEKNLSDEELIKKIDEIMDWTKTDEGKEGMDFVNKHMINLGNVYETNFKTDSTELVDSDYFKFILTVIARIEDLKKQNKRYNFIEYISMILQSQEGADYENEEKTLYLLIIEILKFLAFCIYCSDKSGLMTKQFEEILYSNEECKKYFYEMRSDELSVFRNIIIKYSPESLYNVQKIAAVLASLKDETIARKIKKIIMGSKLGNKIDSDLGTYNKKHTELAGSNGIFKLCQYQTEFAYAFILSFLKDEIMTAPYTIFIKFALANMNVKNIYFLGDDACRLYDFAEYCSNDENEEKDFKQAELLLDQYQKRIHEFSLEELSEFDSLKIFFEAMILNDKQFNIFLKNSFCELIEAYKEKILIYLYYEYKNQDAGLISEEQKTDDINKIFGLCINLYFSDSVFEYEKFMPDAVYLDNDEENKRLHEHINELNSEIQEKNKLIDLYCQKEKNSNFEKKAEIDKEVKKVVNSYNKELTKLSKDNKEKDEQIEVLKENQEELFKLRETLFKISQSENEVYDENQDMDLRESLKDILSKKNVYLAGGHANVTSRLKTLYPSLKLIKNSSDADEMYLINADYVFIFHNFLNHTLYYKLIALLSKNKIKWDYIPFTNLEKTINLIYEDLKEF